MKLNIVRMSGIFALSMLSILGCGDAHQIGLPEKVATMAQALSVTPDFVLTPFPGFAVDIGVGPASPWVIGTDNQPYQYTGDPGQRVWQSHPLPSGYAQGIAVSPEGTPWVIQVDGNTVNIVSFVNPGWVRLAYTGGPACFSDIGVGSSPSGVSQILAIGCDYDFHYGSSIYLFDPFSATWIPQGGRATRIAVSPEGGVWVVNAQGNIFAWSSVSESFSTQLPGCGKAIGAGPNATPWVIGCDNHPYRWTGTQFVQASNTTGTEISVGADGTPWLVNSINQIFQYASSWQFVGPQGFVINDVRFAGEIHDIDATGPNLVVAATSGGVWQRGPSGWAAVADVGSAPGPNMSASTVVVKPGDPNTIIVGTGVPLQVNNGTNARGNGIWYTHNGGATWSPAICTNISNVTINCPTQVTKIRYGNDGTVYLAGAQSVFSGGELFGAVIFQQQWTSSPQASITDLVVDPNNASTVYFGVVGVGQGVYRSTTRGSNPGVSSPSLIVQQPIRDIALAITANVGGTAGVTGVYAMSASSGLPNKGYPDFNGIAYTDNSRWPTWNPMTPQPTSAFGSNGNLDSQGLHNWALAVDSTGATILAAGRNLFRGSNCAYAHCNTWAQVDHGVSASLHDDYHALAFSSTIVGLAYAANDGGIYASTDGGFRWSSGINSLGVMNEWGVDVQGSAVYAAAHDVGVNFSLDWGSSWWGPSNTGGASDDMQTTLIDNANAIGNAYACHNGADPLTRWTASTSLGAPWSNIDGALSPSASSRTCFMAKKPNTPLFTSFGTAVYADGESVPSGRWTQYGGNLPWFAGLLAVTSNDSPPTVYVAQFGGASGLPVLQVSRQGAGFQPLTICDAQGICLPLNDNVVFLALNRESDDLYVLGGIGSPGSAGVVYETGDRGQTWTRLTGNLNQSDGVTSVAWDPSTRAAFVGTQGPGSGMYKLVNPTVRDPSIQWVPWVTGLPVAEQPVSWLAGQYETNGNVSNYYIYAATWGRGIWKRAAIGSDL